MHFCFLKMTSCTGASRPTMIARPCRGCFSAELPQLPRRTAGAVGGAPVPRFNSNFLAVSSDVLGHGLWTVGDTVFPGQGIMATVISAIRVVERLTGTTWAKIRRAHGPDHDRAGLAGSACLQPQP